MSDIPALDVAIGMSFVFFVMAVFATAITEAVASILGTRSRTLEGWLKDNLTPPAGSGKEFRTGRNGTQAVVDQIYAHPAVNSLTRNSRLTGKAQRPSYIPAGSLLVALLEAGGRTAADAEKELPEAKEAVKAAAGAEKQIHDLINALPKGSPIRVALTDIWNRAGGDLETFRAAAEAWFDHAMDRLSGWYKRRTQLFLWIFGLGLAVVLNVDAIHAAEVLWRDQGTRAAVTTLAQHARPTGGGSGFDAAYNQLQNLPLPLGWDGKGNPFPPSGWQNDIVKVLGLLLTSGAVGMGAPFWFDTLTRLGSLRGTGPKPPTAAQAAAAKTP